MSSFTALMKLSQTQTAQSELAVQTQIASHQTQLEKKRREQEARERKEREVEAKLRAKRLEEQRREAERKRKLEEAERARERELARREAQMRDALKYGPRKSSASAPGSSSRSRGSDRGGDAAGNSGLTREELRERRHGSPDASPAILTREEKRDRKLAAELRRSAIASSRRSGGGAGRTASMPDGRTVRRLPGGAIDLTTVSRLADPDAAPATPPPEMSGKTARERLAAMPSTLTKLNTVKRDLRTIDEILVDRAKARQAKILAGDEAKDFSDWFGKGKKEARLRRPKVASAPSSRAVSATPSVSPSPALNALSSAPASKGKLAAAAPPKPAASLLKPTNPKPSTVNLIRTSSATAPSPTKKRPRSPSADTPPPPAKRRPAASSSRVEADIGNEIWSIFGKDKRSYLARDVLSDDEDMEADAESVLKEELIRCVHRLPFVCRTLGPQPLSRIIAVLASHIRRMSSPSLRRRNMKKRRGGGRRSASAGKGPESTVVRASHLGMEGTKIGRSFPLIGCLFFLLCHHLSMLVTIHIYSFRHNAFLLVRSPRWYRAMSRHYTSHSIYTIET